MAGMNFTRHNVETYGRGKLLLVGSFDCNGSSAPASPTGDLAKLGSWTHSDTGEFTYTFTQRPGSIIEAVCSFRGDFTEGDQVEIGVISSADGTITVLTKDAGGATDIAAVEEVRVAVMVWVDLYKNMLNP